ncbi:unnamed protein product [Cunninghamella echinulata]
MSDCEKVLTEIAKMTGELTKQEVLNYNQGIKLLMVFSNIVLTMCDEKGGLTYEPTDENLKRVLDHKVTIDQ